MRTVAGLAPLVLLLPFAAAAQISAAQGVTAPDQGTQPIQSEFHSPMVLDVPLPLTDRGQWGNGHWSDPGVFQQLHDYRCDGMAIVELRMRGTAKSDGTLKVEVKGKIDAIKGHDKRVDMKFEFLNGGSVAAAGYANKLKVPDEEVRSFSFSFSIPANAVLSEPPTRLRITLSDYDD